MKSLKRFCCFFDHKSDHLDLHQISVHSQNESMQERAKAVHSQNETMQERAKDIGEEAMYLPEDIIHHILSHLNSKQKAQLCVLSKAWLSACRTYPKLDFDYQCFDKEKEKENFHGHDNTHLSCCKQTQQNFRNHVKGALANFKEGPHHIEEVSFDLSLMLIFIGDHDDWNSFISEQFGIVVEKGAKVIRFSGKIGIVLPRNILMSKSLTDLSISGAMIESGTSVMCNNVRSLKLRNVYIDDDMFRSFICSCPLITDLVIENCKELETMRVTNLPELKRLDISCRRTRKKPTIEVDAPSVETIDLRFLNKIILELQGSTSLKRLRLSYMYIQDTFFVNLMNKFPNLECLGVVFCHGFKTINFISHSLRHIRLSFIPGMSPIKVEIDAPNIIEIECGRYEIIRHKLCFRGASDALVSVRHFGTLPCLNTKWFRNFKELLSTLRPSKVSLDMDCLEEVQEKIKIPTCVKNAVEIQELDLKLTVGLSSKACLSILHGLFWACRPNTIVLHAPFHEAKVTMAGYLYKILITESRYQYFSKLSSLTGNNWQHDLKKVEIEIDDQIGKEYCLQQPWKNFRSLPHSSKVVFKLQWKKM